MNHSETGETRNTDHCEPPSKNRNESDDNHPLIE